MGSSDYSTWSTEDLVKRVTSLEQQLKEQTTKLKAASSSPKPSSPPRKPKNARVNREFDPSKYSTRFIALKFAYLGQRYNGLEYHSGNDTPLPTVEEELWKALNKARLIFPTPKPTIEPGDPNWEGCEYSKCGRTDKGVSAFGQVVGIRVRSNRLVPRSIDIEGQEDGGQPGKEEEKPDVISADHKAGAAAQILYEPGDSGGATPSSSTVIDTFNSINDEIPYCQVLNRLLPPDIRMLAWCPNPPPGFSARFSCRERQYRYYFTQPAFHSPISISISSRSSRSLEQPEGYLDIPAMRTAAHKFAGLHDFRNLCKVDPSKQIENFERRLFHADIQCLNGQHPADSSVASTSQPDPPSSSSISGQAPLTPQIYAFTLHGSAFLWHQVRHMVSILFLIGQGLESPSLIDSLLDVRKNPCKPQYEMAHDAPLVLWDCKFPRDDDPNRDDALEWIYENPTPAVGSNKPGGLTEDVWRVWRQRKIDEVLAGDLLNLALTQNATDSFPNVSPPTQSSFALRSQRIFQGGNAPKLAGTYIPVMQKPRKESIEVLNARYAQRKGFEQSEEVREVGFRRVDLQGREE